LLRHCEAEGRSNPEAENTNVNSKLHWIATAGKGRLAMTLRCLMLARMRLRRNDGLESLPQPLYAGLWRFALFSGIE
jgi:hypothetical protein